MLKALQLPVFIILMIVVVFLSWVVGWTGGWDEAKAPPAPPLSDDCRQAEKEMGFGDPGLNCDCPRKGKSRLASCLYP